MLRQQHLTLSWQTIPASIDNGSPLLISGESVVHACKIAD